MKNLATAFQILTERERRTALFILPLIILNGLADMIGVALIFPFLKVLEEPEIIRSNTYLSSFYNLSGVGTSEDFIILLGLAFCSVLLATAVLKIVTVYIANRWLEGRIHSLSRRLLTAYLRQPYEFMLRRNSGELVANMLSETGRVVSQVFRALSEFIMSAVTFLFMVVLLLVVSPGMTVIALGTFAFFYITLLLGVRGVTARLGTRILSSNRTRHRLAWEALAGAKQVRLLNRERALIARYSKVSTDFARANATSNTLRMAPRYIIESIAIGGTILLTIVLMMQGGGLDSGAMASILPTLGLFALATFRMMPAFQRGYNASVSLRLSSASAQSILEDFRASTNLPELPQTHVEPLRLKQRIQFDGVCYRYPEAESDGLRDIDLIIEAGTSVGIIGRTGSGKTTLMDLILGLLNPTEGKMRIDGRALTPAELRAWRANVGYVQQDIFLSDATIAENIAFGVPRDEIDDVRLRAAARAAQIDDYIMDSLPDGYETFVGERGVRLSGGQRQRISIARALYPDPQVVVFDEATSALDNATESQLMEAISKLAGSRTLIMVAHRHTTIRDCDMIVTLDGGRIVSIGNGDDLVPAEETVLPFPAGGR